MKHVPINIKGYEPHSYSYIYKQEAFANEKYLKTSACMIGIAKNEQIHFGHTYVHPEWKEDLL